MISSRSQFWFGRIGLFEYKWISLFWVQTHTHRMSQPNQWHFLQRGLWTCVAERSALFGHIFMCTYYCDNPHHYVILTLDTELGFKYLWTTVQFRSHSSNDTAEIHMDYTAKNNPTITASTFVIQGLMCLKKPAIKTWTLRHSIDETKDQRKATESNE